MNGQLLPQPFQALEPFASEWSIGDEAGRNLKRISSTIESLREFYQAVLPEMQLIVDYLRPRPLLEFNSQQLRLLNLAKMLMEVAPAIEIFNQPDVPNSFEPERFLIMPPFADTPAGLYADQTLIEQT